MWRGAGGTSARKGCKLYVIPSVARDPGGSAAQARAIQASAIQRTNVIPSVARDRGGVRREILPFRQQRLMHKRHRERSEKLGGGAARARAIQASAIQRTNVIPSVARDPGGGAARDPSIPG